jgi:hypothetical protein
MPDGDLESIVSNPLEELLGKEQFFSLREEALKKYSNLITKIDEKTKTAFNLDKIVDKFKKGLEENTKKIEESTSKKILPKIPDQKKESKENPIDKIKDTPAASVLPQNLQNAQKPQQDDGEQKTLGPKVQQVEFSEKTQSFFKSIFKNLGVDPKMQDEMRKYFKDSLEKQDEMLANTKQEGFLGLIGKLLAIGGIATLLVTAFWDKIKPWLEDAIGTKLDFLDKFKGIAEGIGKFFTMGGLKIAFGGITSLVGKAFTSFGDLLENVLKGAIKMILPAAEGVGEGAAAAAKSGGLFKGLLPKLIGGVFKGIGSTVLNGIPLIGSLISLYFAYDRFKGGDYVGAVIDLVGGISNLLVFTPLAEFALPLSLGAAALNAFLDYKAGNSEDKQGAKLGALGDILTGFYGFLKKIPVVGTILNGVEGLWGFVSSLATGDFGGVKDGLEKMAAVPLFGFMPSFLLGFLDSAKTDASGKVVGFDTGNMIDNLKKRVGKTILGWFSWMPSAWQGWIAEKLGIPFNGNANDEVPQNQQQTPQPPPPITSKEQQEVAKAVGKTPSSPQNKVKNETNNDNVSEKADSKKEENQKFDNLEQKQSESQGFDLNALKNPLAGVGDLLEKFSKIDIGGENKDSNLKYEPSEKETPKILEDKTEVKYQPIKNDEPPKTTDPDVIMQKTHESTNILIKAVQSLVQVLKDGQENPIPITVSGGGNSSPHSGKDYLFSTQIDPNTSARNAWWGNSERIRATI